MISVTRPDIKGLAMICWSRSLGFSCSNMINNGSKQILEIASFHCCDRNSIDEKLHKLIFMLENNLANSFSKVVNNVITPDEYFSVLDLLSPR